MTVYFFFSITEGYPEYNLYTEGRGSCKCRGFCHACSGTEFVLARTAHLCYNSISTIWDFFTAKVYTTDNDTT